MNGKESSTLSGASEQMGGSNPGTRRTDSFWLQENYLANDLFNYNQSRKIIRHLRKVSNMKIIETQTKTNRKN